MDEFNVIDDQIYRLLEKLGAHYGGYDEKKNRLIFDDWRRALFIYPSDVLKNAYHEAIETFNRRPTLADFIAVCKKRMASERITINANVDAKRFTSEEHLELLRRQFGDEVYFKLKAEDAKYAEQKTNGTVGDYQAAIMGKIRSLFKKK